MVSQDRIGIFSSFRDPAGFVFSEDGIVYRQINAAYKENYQHLITSGLYDKLVNEQLLVPHHEVPHSPDNNQIAYKIIKPEHIPFISYPYEWCFSQLKHAASTIIKIQRISLDFGMTLKDSSAYNIQFKDGKPILIDTLSFERYHPGQSWYAYRQFCQHFLVPLALMSYVQVNLNQLLQTYVDGIPLELAMAILPLRSHFKFSLFSHIHMHAKIKNFYEAKRTEEENRHLSLTGLYAVIDNLESAIRHLKWATRSAGWSEYYGENNYSSESMQHKNKAVSEFIGRIKAELIFDLGANTGFFSRIPSRRNIRTVSIDRDHAVVEQNYLGCIKDKIENILPLVIDITNPSPAIGWENKERLSFIERASGGTILALALIHHLVISYNIPLEKVAYLFQKMCDTLIIEFVPKTDYQVKRLLMGRDDIFSGYNQQDFERVFKEYFSLEGSVKLRDSDRVIYLFRRQL